MELPVELWALVIQRLPDGRSRSRHRASQVCRAAHKAEQRCDRRVELGLGSWDRQLRALAAWGRLRTGAVALALSSRVGFPNLELSLCSLARLGLVPRLTSLELSLNLAVDYSTLGCCTALTALRVRVPVIARLECGLADSEAVQDEMEFLNDCGAELVIGAVREGSVFTALATLLQLLQPAVQQLKQLQSLDVEGMVPPRGDLRVAGGIQLPRSSALPWLSCLTQLTRLKARAFNVDEGVLSLPCLRELHVCGGYRSETVLRDGDVVKVDYCLGMSAAMLGRIGPQLSRLVLESCCLIQGQALALNSVKDLRLISCVRSDSYLQVSCPSLCSLRVDTTGSVADMEGPSDSEADSEEEEYIELDRHRLALRIEFQPLPQLTELVLGTRDGDVLDGAEEGLLQHVRSSAFTLPGLVDLYGD